MLVAVKLRWVRPITALTEYQITFYYSPNKSDSDYFSFQKIDQRIYAFVLKYRTDGITCLDVYFEFGLQVCRIRIFPIHPSIWVSFEAAKPIFNLAKYIKRQLGNRIKISIS